jgi:hypothetical protein
MGIQTCRSLIEILRATVRRIEQTADLAQDDPAVLELKRSLARIIAELEIAQVCEAHGIPITKR